MPNDHEYSTNEAWKELLAVYAILLRIQQDGFINLSANQIKQYREPRLMAKFDSTDSLPKVFRDNKINILPISRGEYILGDFVLYEQIPELNEPIIYLDPDELPYLESIDLENISSEANAINAMCIAHILDDFLKTDENISTFNGRMKSGAFDFVVDTYRGIPKEISVNNAQCEIDGGFENSESIVILEAKNMVHEDFHVRQLYYPYRLWRKKVNKPIRLVFLVYTNKIFRLFEYKFSDPSNYSSIELVQNKNYSLQDTKISIEELADVRKTTPTVYNDRDSGIPFVQADSFERVISLLEILYNNPMTPEQVAEHMDFDIRQSDYYFNAGRYLGLFEKKTENHQIVIGLTKLGEEIFKLNYKPRQLKLVHLILQHEVFAAAFDRMIATSEIPDKDFVIEVLTNSRIINSEATIKRRAGSIIGWLKWIYNLTKL